MILGYVAGFFTTLAFVPQVYRVFRTKKVEDLSWGLAIMYWVGIFLWLTYGIVLNDASIYIANGCSLLLSSLIMFAKIKYHS